MSARLAVERKVFIINQVNEKNTVQVNDLAEQLNVSAMTIRRDLIELEKEGLIRRIHGGATNSRARSFEPPLDLRSSQNVEVKQQIGNAAAKLIAVGDAIALDVGSTTTEVAQHLPKNSNLTIITPSLPIATLLYKHPTYRVILTGGIIRQGETSLVGDLAVKAFEGLYFDKLFLGVGGISHESGFTEFNWDDVLVKKAMIKSAKEIYVVADSSKFDQVAFISIAPLEKADYLITNKEPSEPLKQALEEAGVSIILANND